jgi:hypothetical protein
LMYILSHLAAIQLLSIQMVYGCQDSPFKRGMTEGARSLAAAARSTHELSNILTSHFP